MKIKKMKALALLNICVWMPMFGQEVFLSNDGTLYSLFPSHFYLTTAGSYADYMTADPAKAAKVSGSDVTLSLSRFYENSTIGFQSQSGIIQIPASVISEAISTSNKGLTISGWLKISDFTNNRSIGFFGTESGSASGVKLDIALINKRIVIRKKSRLKSNTLSPVITTDFSTDFGSFSPVTGDITNGYFYFSIASDNKTCRVTLYRPGGRLFTRWYYTSLTDVLTVSDSFFWGRSPVLPNAVMDIPNSFDDIMTYNRYLSAEETLNVFYNQSPLYPGISYSFSTIDNLVLSPKNYDNEKQVLNNDYFIWHDKVNTNTGPLSYDKWFIRLQAKTALTSDPCISFSNAHSGGNIYQETSSNYFYQLLEPSGNYPNRTQHFMQRVIDPKNLYNVTPDAGGGDFRGHIWFQTKYDPKFYLGQESRNLYLSYKSNRSQFRIRGAQKVHRGAERSLFLSDATKMYTMIKNYQSNKYMDMYWGGQYYYLVLNDRNLDSNNQKFLITQSWQADYNTDIRYQIKALSGGNISPYWGMKDQKEDEYIVIYDQEFNWELLYIKEDANNRPLYAIRSNNDWGSYLLGYKDATCGEVCYAIQASVDAYTSSGSVKDNFLWSIDVHAGSAVATRSSLNIENRDDEELLRNQSDVYRISPNPTDGAFSVLSKEAMKDTKVIIYDLKGLKMEERIARGVHTEVFNIASYPSGMYTIQIVTPEKSVQRKIIKK